MSGHKKASTNADTKRNRARLMFVYLYVSMRQAFVKVCSIEKHWERTTFLLSSGCSFKPLLYNKKVQVGINTRIKDDRAKKFRGPKSQCTANLGQFVKNFNRLLWIGELLLYLFKVQRGLFVSKKLVWNSDCGSRCTSPTVRFVKVQSCTITSKTTI